MSVPTQQRFDYDSLDRETRSFVLERAERIHNLARMTAASIVQIGQYLTETKEQLGHGKFLEWIVSEFAWSRMTAERFMTVHERFKMHNLCNLDIDVSALYLIAAPSTPEPVRTEVLRRAENGEQVRHEGARALVKRFAETGELPDVKISMTQIVEDRREVLAQRSASAPIHTYPEPQITRMSASEMREAQELRERMRINGLRASAVMAVINAVESLNSTTLLPADIAAEIERLDTPDKDWHSQMRCAQKQLTAICRELKR